MELSCEPAEPVAGDEISIAVRIPNGTGAPFYLSEECSVYLNYGVAARRLPEGDPVSRTYLGRGRFQRGSVGLDRIEPGGAVTALVPVGRLLDLSQPGEYLVTVTRHGYSVAGMEKAEALTAEIVVEVGRPAGWYMEPAVSRGAGQEKTAASGGGAGGPGWPMAIATGLAGLAAGLLLGFLLAALVFRRRRA